MVELCKALEELHVELEELPLDQYRARDELLLVQQWARGRADDRVTLSADLETMDLLTTATPPPTLSAAEPRRLPNDFEDFIGTRLPQLIRSVEIALPLLTSWDLLVFDKPLIQGLAVTRAQSRYWRRPLVRARAASYPYVRAIPAVSTNSAGSLDQCHARRLVLHR